MLLFYHNRSQNVLRNGFFQMFGLFLSSSLGVSSPLIYLNIMKFEKQYTTKSC